MGINIIQVEYLGLGLYLYIDDFESEFKVKGESALQVHFMKSLYSTLYASFSECVTVCFSSFHHPSEQVRVT